MNYLFYITFECLKIKTSLYMEMPNRNYYQVNKEKLKEQAKIRYSNKFIEKKEKSKEYYRNWCSNLDKYKQKQIRANAKNRYNMNNEQMQKHKEYQKNYQKMYCAKKKQELENSRKEQGDFDKSAVLTPPKT